MANIKIDVSRTAGAIKPVHGVGQPPILGVNFMFFHYLTDAGIPYSRLHDVGNYLGGRFVDIHCIFRDFDADPSDPASYDFAFTDKLITALIEAGVEPYFRLGETIENYCDIKSYHIHPPKDNLKWAKICEGIIRHYTEGWADGFNYKITYWEIWNEPDNGRGNPENMCWTGTKEQFFELYGVASKYLKEKFPHLKIGGYASCGFYAINEAYKNKGRYQYFLKFFDEFLDFVIANKCPLDFFSWHTYEPELELIRVCARYARQRLDEAGFTETETSCNEWNCRYELRGTPKHAALTAAALTIFQDEPVDNAMFYDARIGTSKYGGLFDPMNWVPLKSYYPFMAFSELYKLGNCVKTEIEDSCGIYCVAATDGNTTKIMVVNPTDKAVPLSIDNVGSIISCKAIDVTRNLENCEFSGEIGSDTVLLIEVN